MLPALVSHCFAESAEHPLSETATAFAGDLAARISAVLCDAGAIDPASREEKKAHRRQLRRRQDELYRWYESKGRNVSLRDCKTETDRANYREFRKIMANADFLELSYRRRLHFVSRIERHFMEMRPQFSPALEAVVGAVSEPDRGGERRSSQGRLHAFFLGRLQQPLTIGLSYFGRGLRTGYAAVYTPKTQTMLLNLNLAQSRPAEFIDAFEHELWHHLIPVRIPDDMTNNLWWEGFAETVAELWSEEVHERMPRARIARSSSIEYPVQVAFCALYLGMERQLTFEYLCGLRDAADFSRAFAAGTYPPAAGGCRAMPDSQVPPVRRILGDIISKPAAIDSEKRHRIEKLLSDWGWKEDDGSRISIGKYIANGDFEATELGFAFRLKKQLLFDLIQAVTVVNLQDLTAAVPTRCIVGMLVLPQHLTANVRDVCHYVRNPYRQYANR